MGCSLCSDSLPPHLHLRELLAHPYVAATRELSQPSNAVIASVIPITASPPLGEAVAEFLARRDLDDHTRRSYGQTMTRLRRELGDAAVLADVNPGDVASVFAAWDDAAARTWNRHRSAVRSFAAWAAGPSRAWVTADLAALLERRPETRNRTRAIARHEVDALLSRGDVPLREKTLWRLLYESAARADSVLSLDIEDLDKVPLCWRRSVLAWVGCGLVPARELDPHGRGQSGAQVRGQRAGAAEYFFRLAQRVFRRAEQSAGDGGVGAGGRDHGVVEDQEHH